MQNSSDYWCAVLYRPWCSVKISLTDPNLSYRHNDNTAQCVSERSIQDCLLRSAYSFNTTCVTTMVLTTIGWQACVSVWQFCSKVLWDQRDRHVCHSRTSTATVQLVKDYSAFLSCFNNCNRCQSSWSFHKTTTSDSSASISWLKVIIDLWFTVIKSVLKYHVWWLIYFL